MACGGWFRRPKEIFKVKYFSGAFSYGAKIKRNAYIKNHIDPCMLQFLCAFSWVQEAIFYVAINFVDFTLKIFPARHTLLTLIEFEGTKLELQASKRLTP
jgi:hypothetical protein